jgi:hypothetical protein
MKKVLCFLILLLGFTFALQAQLFKPVPLFPTTKDRVVNPKAIQMQFRLDATLSLAEAVWHKDTKTFETKFAVGTGPAFGVQFYRPKSAIDPTPVNVFGASVGALLGDQFKTVLQLNVWQYFKFGGTFALNPPTNIGRFGVFFGSGITF